MFKVRMRGKSFSLDPFEEKHVVFSAKESVAEVWHKRLGHYHYEWLVKMQKMKIFKDLPFLEVHSSNCLVCQYGKQNRLPFLKTTWRASKKLQLIHTDIAGPQRTPSLKGSV